MPAPDVAVTLACVNVMIASVVPTLLHNTAAAAELLPSKIFTMPVFVNTLPFAAVLIATALEKSAYVGVVVA
jgi:hypothetical protein